MELAEKYRRIILSRLEPGEAYRRCLEELARDGITADYAFTETIVYNTEVRCALDVLRNGRPPRWVNFGDLHGHGDAELWAILDRVEGLRLAFVGSGPFPITALQLHERYPDARITCIDNNIVAHRIGEALFARLRMEIATVFAEAIELDYRPYTVVLVSAMVSGKRALAEKILRTTGALVIVRGAVDLGHERLIPMPAPFDDNGCLVGGRIGAPRAAPELTGSRC
jgi:hypothetical protein